MRYSLSLVKAQRHKEGKVVNIFVTIGIAVGLCCVGMIHSPQAFSPDVDAGLKSKKEIYVATQRKNGAWSKAAPVWFMYDGETVYITASPTSYKAKRVKRGSPVKVSVGSPDGPSFTGKAELFTDSTVVTRMGEVYSEKYWIAWIGIARPRLSRVESGKTVAIRITPLAQGTEVNAPQE